LRAGLLGFFVDCVLILIMSGSQFRGTSKPKRCLICIKQPSIKPSTHSLRRAFMTCASKKEQGDQLGLLFGGNSKTVTNSTYTQENAKNLIRANIFRLHLKPKLSYAKRSDQPLPRFRRPRWCRHNPAHKAPRRKAHERRARRAPDCRAYERTCGCVDPFDFKKLSDTPLFYHSITLHCRPIVAHGNNRGSCTQRRKNCHQ
jgi:hypothetical protein